MGQTVSDFIIERLNAWGIDRVYGYSGDGINGIISALRRAEPKIRMVQPQHEEIGAFMACAHAKFTDQPGVCISTSGPGAVHLLNGLYDAKRDHMPVVAIVGQQARISIGTDYQQEIDLMSLFEDRSWQQKLIEDTKNWWELMDDRTEVSAKPINPQRIFWSLNRRLPDNAMLASDVGSATNWYARYLKIRPGMIGLKGLRMSVPEDIDRVWDEALAADRPVVINAYVDPEVRPLPPHIKMEQAKGFLASVLKGDPSAWRMATQSMKQMAAKY